MEISLWSSGIKATLLHHQFKWQLADLRVDIGILELPLVEKRYIELPAVVQLHPLRAAF